MLHTYLTTSSYQIRAVVYVLKTFFHIKPRKDIVSILLRFKDIILLCGASLYRQLYRLIDFK